MPNVSEKVRLLGKGLYKTFPDEITIKTMPTVSELDYVASEDFDNVMLTKILPEFGLTPVIKSPSIASSYHVNRLLQNKLL